MFHILNGSAEERGGRSTVCRSRMIDVERALYKYVCIYIYIYVKYTHGRDRGERSAQSRTYVKNHPTDRILVADSWRRAVSEGDHRLIGGRRCIGFWLVRPCHVRPFVCQRIKKCIARTHRGILTHKLHTHTRLSTCSCLFESYSYRFVLFFLMFNVLQETYSSNHGSTFFRLSIIICNLYRKLIKHCVVALALFTIALLLLNYLFVTIYKLCALS